jgi:hypothetical protein
MYRITEYDLDKYIEIRSSENESTKDLFERQQRFYRILLNNTNVRLVKQDKAQSMLIKDDFELEQTISD